MKPAGKQTRNQSTSRRLYRHLDFQNWLNIELNRKDRPTFVLDTLVIIGLVTTGLYLFHFAFDHSFLLWDDQFYVTANPFLSQPSWDNFIQLSSSVISLNFHPLTMCSLFINAKLSGIESARPFIITNVLIHITSCCILYLLSRKLFETSRWIPLVVAAIFLIHPMHLESVIWVSERKDVLYAIFFFCSLYAYVLYLHSKNYSYWLTSFFLFLLSCLSKATAVTLVPCLVIVDFFLSRGRLRSVAVIDKIPFLVLAIITGIVAIDVQSGGDLHGLLDTTQEVKAVNYNIPVKYRLSNAILANFYYIKQLFYPKFLAAFHPYSMASELSMSAALLTLGISLLTVVISFRKGFHEILFGLLFYYFTIALLLQLIPVGSALVAERYTYVPYVGLSIVLGYLIQQLWQSRYRYVAPIVFGLICTNCIVGSLSYGSKWISHQSLFRHATEVYPDNAYLRYILASGYYNNGEVDEAISELTYAIDSLGLSNGPAYELLGNCFVDIGDSTAAISNLDLALALDTTNVTARYHRGLVLLDLDPRRAIEDFDKCQASGDSYVEPLIYAPRGRCYGLLGNYRQSIDDLSTSLTYFPKDASTYADRAIAYEMLGQIEKAKSDREMYKQLTAKISYDKIEN